MQALGLQRRDQPRIGLGQLEHPHIDRRLGRGHRRRPGLEQALGVVERALGDGPAGEQLLGPAQFAFGELALGDRLVEFRPRQGKRRLGRLHRRAGFRLAADIEKRRIDRFDLRHHGLVGDHLIANLGLDTPQPPGDRRRQHEDVAHPGLRFLVDGHHQRAPRDVGEIDRHRLRAKGEREAGEHRHRQNAPQAKPAPLHRPVLFMRLSSFAGFQNGDQVEPIEPPPDQHR